MTLPRLAGVIELSARVCAAAGAFSFASVVGAQSDSVRRHALQSLSTATYTVHGDTIRWIPDPSLFATMRHPIDTLKFIFRGDSAVIFTPMGPAAVSRARAASLRRSIQEIDYSRCLQKQLGAAASHELSVCDALIPQSPTPAAISRSRFIQLGDTVRWIRTHGRVSSGAKSVGTAPVLQTDTMDFMFRGDSAVILRPKVSAVSPFFASVLRKLMDSEAFTEQLERGNHNH